MLKKILPAIALAAVVTFSAFSPAQAADAKAEPKVVVVDIQRIMRDSLAAKDLKTQLESQRNSYQSDIKNKEDKLKKEEDDLGKQKNVLSKDALTQKQKSFVDEINNVRKDVEEKRVKLDNAYKQALNEIQSAVQDIINDMAKEQGFNLAIPTSQLVYADKSFDVSDEVLKRLDKKLPKVSLKFESK